MPDLEQQLRDYGAYLDELGAEPVFPVAAHHRDRSRLVAAAVVAVLVAGGVALAAPRHSSHHVTTIGAGGSGSSAGPSAASTTTFDSSAIASARPTFDQQVAQLEAWYAHAVADAPGGRPILLSEYEVCDYRGAPSLGTDVQGGFASYFPLGQRLTEAQLVEGCLHRDDIPKGTTAPHQLCAADRRDPVYDASAAVKVFTKPVVMFGRAACATAGYAPFTSGLLDALNHRRRVEIEMWAVPRSCPTEEEAAFWAEKISEEQLGRAWTVVAPPPLHAGTTLTLPSPSSSPAAGSCVRAGRIDWDLERVTLERF